MLGLYIHIPFCSRICPYCDFAVVATNSPPEKLYIGALEKELLEQATKRSLTRSKLQSIFWGGGTPSLLSARSFEKIHEVVDHIFQVDWKTIEVSLEGNPPDISREKAKELRIAGINRLSIGAQSLNSQILSTLGRKHSKRDVQDAVVFAREAGIFNINCDLIFGVPGQTTSELDNDIYEYVELNPSHVSTYSLTIEKGTPFFKAVASGAMQQLKDSEMRKQYERVLDLLPKFHYEHYEISNFALNGYQCQHNRGYWNRQSYLGIGVGAHSFLSKSNERWSNLKSLPNYLQQIEQQGEAIAWSENLTPEEVISEKIFLSLRTKEGLIMDNVLPNLPGQRASQFTAQIYNLSEAGLLEHEIIENSIHRIKLTREGFCVADSVMESLIASTQ